MIKPNDQIGPYVLMRQLGKGGFGVVWLAERRSRLATTEVALKLILDDEPDIDEIAKESQVWVQAGGHPNVLSIIEANVYDNQIVIVSEYVPDGSLQDFLKQNKVVPLVEALNLTCGILAGLEHLHSRKIIHRDLKPANILLNKGIPRLADFGLARVMKSSNNSGSIAGTPSYMAPEAFDGKRSIHSDIWSVGVIFYQLLCGKLPFPQTDMTALVGAIINRQPEPLPSNIPGVVKAVAQRALQKNVEKRFESATEMRISLQRIITELDLPTLNSKAITTRFPLLAFNSATRIEKERSSTFGNRLNTNTLSEKVFDTPNQTLKPTEKVLQPTERVFKSPYIVIPPSQKMKPEPSKVGIYAGLSVVALSISLAGFALFNSSLAKNQTSLDENKASLELKKPSFSEKTGETVIIETSTSETSTISTEKLNEITEIEKEQVAWKKINKKPEDLTLNEINLYLAEFPNGSHVPAAKVLFREVEKLLASNSSQPAPTQNNLPTEFSAKVDLNNKESNYSRQSSNMYMKTSDGKMVEVNSLNSYRRFEGRPPLRPGGGDWQRRPPLPLTTISGDWREVTGAQKGRLITFDQERLSANLNDGSPAHNLKILENGVFGFKTKLGGKEYKVMIEFHSDREATKKCYDQDGNLANTSTIVRE